VETSGVEPASSAPASGGYAEVYRGVHPPTARALARHAYLSTAALVSTMAGVTARAMRRPRVQFVFLHHVFPDQEEGFRALLRSLLKDFTPVGYAEAVDRILEGRIDRPYLALSFDDGFESCVRAAEIMAEFGLKGCFFVCAKAPTLSSFDQVRTFCRERFDFPPTRFMSWRQIEQLAAAGHEIGGHTVSHPPNLAALSRQQQTEEIGRCADELRARFGQPGHFTWPWGTLDRFPPAARRLVFASGFRSCASVLRGCHVAPPAGGDRPRCASVAIMPWPTGRWRTCAISLAATAGRRPRRRTIGRRITSPSPPRPPCASSSVPPRLRRPFVCLRLSSHARPMPA
jgi:peptidoglycan/xylan/chitin deacetylase (PgdA/CDA1 family)